MVGFLFNSTIKRPEEVKGQILTAFSHQKLKIYESRHAGHIKELATQAVQDGCTHIIATGGDGSLNESLNGILQGFRKKEGQLGEPEELYDLEGLKQIKFGVLPAGSGNDFSRSVKVGNDLNQLKDLIQADKSKIIDIGWAGFTGRGEQPEHRFFINIADVGMGGSVAVEIEKSGKRWGANWAYTMAIAKTFFTYNNVAVRCYNDHFEWEGKVMNLVLANGKYFGSGLGIAPEAELDSGEFSLVILGEINLWHYISHMPALRKAKKIAHPKIFYFSVNDLMVEGMDETLPIDMDGELVGYTPVRFRKLKQVLSFIC